MTEKFIFDSEEHCRNVIFGGLSEYCLTGEMENQIVENIKTKGFIRKSELAQMVDEAEEMYEDIIIKMKPVAYPEIVSLCKKMNKTIQALKKEVIKLGGKI